MMQTTTVFRLIGLAHRQNHLPTALPFEPNSKFRSGGVYVLGIGFFTTRDTGFNSRARQKPQQRHESKQHPSGRCTLHLFVGRGGRADVLRVVANVVRARVGVVGDAEQRVVHSTLRTNNTNVK